MGDYLVTPRRYDEFHGVLKNMKCTSNDQDLVALAFAVSELLPAASTGAQHQIKYQQLH